MGFKGWLCSFWDKRGNDNMKITQAQGNGQGQCALCKKRGKWNVQWMCFLYEIEGKEGVYCKNCADEIKIQNSIDGRK